MQRVEAEAVYCDCHGTEKMAVRSGDRIVIRDRRHGVVHVAVLDLQSLAECGKEELTAK